VRCVMRARVHATGLGMIEAQIARCSFDLHTGNPAAGIRRIVQLHRKWVHIDVPVRAVVGALAAADAPVFDNDLERIAAANRADRTADHAKRIAALAARCRDKVTIKAEPISDEAADAIMGVRAGAHTLIAPGAAVEIENQQALCLHQALIEELIDGNVGGLGHAQAILFHVLGGGLFELAANFREAVEHELEIFAGDADYLDVIQRTAGRDAGRAGQEGHFAKVGAASEIGEDQVAAGTMLGDFDEAEAHEIKAVGRLALAADDLSRRKSQKFDPIAEMVDEVGSQRGEQRHAAQVRIERALAVVAIELLPEGFVALHNVEHVAQHLEHGAIGFGANRG